MQPAVAATGAATELSIKPFIMRLNLALNGILVASAPLDPSRCKDEFYLQALRQQILQQNLDVIKLIPAKPTFYIEVPASPASLSYGKNERRFNA